MAQPQQRLAVDCRWLRRTFDSTRLDSVATLCTHLIRDGRDCVGPFLEDVETDCRLWDPGDRLPVRPLSPPSSGPLPLEGGGLGWG